MSDTDLLSELQALSPDIKGLRRDLDTIARKGRRRWRATLVIGMTVVVLAVAGLAFWLYERDLTKKRDTEIHDLACIAVKRTPEGESATVDELRDRYGCPPYVRASGASQTPSGWGRRTVTATVSVPVPMPGRTVMADRPVATVTRSVPGATRTVTATRTARAPAPAPSTVTRIRTVPVPGPTVTVTCILTRVLCGGGGA